MDSSKLNDRGMLADELVQALLDHIGRYRLTIFAALERLPSLGALGPRGIRDLLRHCRRQGLIASARLHHEARYWYLTPPGAERLGLAPDRAGPLSEPARIRALALLRFCVLSERPRHLLRAAELARAFPPLARPGLPAGYYFDPAGPGRLGLARVDAGHRGRWDRIVHSVCQDIGQHWRRPGFRRFIQAGRFEIAVLTVFPEKAGRIRQSLRRHAEAQLVPVRVVPLRELLPAIHPRP